MKIRVSQLLSQGLTTSLLLGSSMTFVQTVKAADSANAGGTTLEEIVITATRRATVAQDTPMAVTAIGGASLRDAGIVDPRQLSALAPNLLVDQGISNGQTHVTLRGVANTDFGIGANSPVALYIDDVYQPFQFGLATQIFDMNRIEVLRGPQGTLFGKNATSGTLNYYSQTPTDKQEGYVSVDSGAGDFTHHSFEGAYNQPLADDLAMRVSVRVDRRNDYVDNLFDGSELGHYTNYNGRLQFAWSPSDDTKINLKLFGVKNRGDGPVYTSRYLPNATFGNACNIGGPTGRPFFPAGYICVDFVTPVPESPNSRTTYSDVPTYENYHNYGAVLKLDQQLGDYTLTSVTGYQKGEIDIATNDDGLGADAFHSFQGSSTSQISQELRLATSADKVVSAVVGLFGQIDKITTDQGAASTQVDTGTNFPVDNFGYDYYSGSEGYQKDTSVAAFGSVTYNVSSKFALIGGARYSREKKDVTVDFLALNGSTPAGDVHGPFLNLQVDDISYSRVLARYASIFDPLTDQQESFADSHTWSQFTGDFTANFRPSDDALIFARIASGFRSGGYQIGITQAANWNVAKPYVDPEDVMSYEVGAKTEWLNNTLRFNGSLYWMNYSDMQIQVINSSGVGSKLNNAAKSRIKGAELEMEYAPVGQFTLFGSVGYADARFLSYKNNSDSNRPNLGDATGNQLPYSPKWTGNLGAKYEISRGDIYSWLLGTNWSYRSKIYFDSFEEEVASDKSRIIGNVNVSYGMIGTGWRLAAYVNNVTNQDAKAFAFAFGGARQPNSFLIAPAIYAPKLTYGLRASYDF